MSVFSYVIADESRSFRSIAKKIQARENKEEKHRTYLRLASLLCYVNDDVKNYAALSIPSRELLNDRYNIAVVDLAVVVEIHSLDLTVNAPS